MSRVDYVARNAKFAAISQIALVLANFVVRKVFVVTLGENYLGLSGLFTDILSMLSLAELGFGTSVVYSLYKPLAEGDTPRPLTSAMSKICFRPNSGLNAMVSWTPNRSMKNR